MPTKMIVNLSLLAALTFGIGGASAFELPASLLGTWETDPANCSNPMPSTGTQLDFDGDQFSIVHWETEGGSCLVAGVEEAESVVTILARCRDEEGPFDSVEAFAVMQSPDGSAITFDGEAFQRCPK